MELSQLSQEWHTAGQRLGLRVAVRCVVPHFDGARVEVDVWLADFGSEAGMLLFQSDRWTDELLRQLRREDGGYSFLDADPGSSAGDLSGFIECLSDWGWSGEAERRPDWLPEPSGGDDDD